MATAVRSPGRRVVRRARPALDDAWSTVLADLDPRLHAPIRQYIETMDAANEARGAADRAASALSIELSRCGVRWRTIDALVTCMRMSAA